MLDFIYTEVSRPTAKRSLVTKQLLRDEALAAFREWERKADRISY